MDDQTTEALIPTPTTPKPDRTTLSFELSIRVDKADEAVRTMTKVKKALRDFSLEDLKLLLDVIDKGGKHMGKLMTGRYKDGYASGYKDAFVDFTNKRVRLQHFEGPEADFNDLYSVGYELGYKTRLAEMAVK